MGTNNGVKRDHDGNARPGRPEAPAQSKSAPVAPPTPFAAVFEEFRAELDEHHDRKERIIRASRDVTALSKKIIFSCQRAKGVNQPLPESIAKDIRARMVEISTILGNIKSDLKGINRYRYQRQLRCLEELVEALSFVHYLQTQVLITPEAVVEALPSGIAVTPNDYMYGIFDLFGEMMRFATVTAAHTSSLAGSKASGLEGDTQMNIPLESGLEKSPSSDVGKDQKDAGSGTSLDARTMLEDIQELGSCFETLPGVLDKNFSGKMETMRQSVRKVEKLAYGIAVRGSERPRGWVPDTKDEYGAAEE